MLTKEIIIRQLQRLSDFAEDNLGQLDGVKLDEINEIQDYYLGYIRRQSFFAFDLISIFKYSPHKSFVTQFILSRCIVDDYLHLLYLINQADVNEAIICFNADAHKKNFDKISELTDVNEGILGGSFPLYPTSKIRDEVKEKLQKNPNKAQYFTDITNFEFKSAKATGNFIKDFPKDKFGAQVRRAYYLWRHLSDYVHYSKFSFDLEFYPENRDNALNIIQEMIYYSYRLVKISFKYFEDAFGLTLKDRHSLSTHYKATEDEEK